MPPMLCLPQGCLNSQHCPVLAKLQRKLTMLELAFPAEALHTHDRMHAMCDQRLRLVLGLLACSS
jgi:hypothetical protein